MPYNHTATGSPNERELTPEEYRQLNREIQEMRMTNTLCSEHAPLFMESINGPERLTPCIFCQREQLRCNLSLAEEGLASYALEVERLRNDCQELTCGDPRRVTQPKRYDYSIEDCAYREVSDGTMVRFEDIGHLLNAHEPGGDEQFICPHGKDVRHIDCGICHPGPSIEKNFARSPRRIEPGASPAERRWSLLTRILDESAETGELPSGLHEAFQMGGDAMAEWLDHRAAEKSECAHVWLDVQKDSMRAYQQCSECGDTREPR